MNLCYPPFNELIQLTCFDSCSNDHLTHLPRQKIIILTNLYWSDQVCVLNLAQNLQDNLDKDGGETDMVNCLDRENRAFYK